MNQMHKTQTVYLVSWSQEVPHPTVDYHSETVDVFLSPSNGKPIVNFKV